MCAPLLCTEAPESVCAPLLQANLSISELKVPLLPQAVRGGTHPRNLPPPPTTDQYTLGPSTWQLPHPRHHHHHHHQHASPVTTTAVAAAGAVSGPEVAAAAHQRQAAPGLASWKDAAAAGEAVPIPRPLCEKPTTISSSTSAAAAGGGLPADQLAPDEVMLTIVVCQARQSYREELAEIQVWWDVQRSWSGQQLLPGQQPVNGHLTGQGAPS